MKNIARFLCFALYLLLGFKTYSQDVVEPYSQRNIGEVSEVFTAKVNGKPIEITSYKGIHYMRLAQRGKATIEVKFLRTLDDVKISPRLDLNSDKNQVRFTLQKPSYYVLTSKQGEMLFILTDNPEYLSQNERRNLVNISQYKVDPTGRNNCTNEIQQAIDETASEGKILYVGPGVYKTGTLRIGSNAKIYLSQGALINASTDTADYVTDTGFFEANERTSKSFSDNGEKMTFSRLLLIENANHVKIWGRGILNGNGAAIRKTGKPANLLRVRNSKNISIEGICLFDPAAWNTHILYSDSVTLKNVKIINDPEVKNTDGIDPDASSNVLIKDCFAYCSDDNIAIKSSNNGNLLKDCENVVVEGCVFLTRKSALKVGTETKAAHMRNIVFQNNWIVLADRGLTLYCFDGARFENIRFINNYFEYGFADNERKAIHFVIKDRSGKGFISDILIKDCFFSPQFHSGIELSGLNKDHTITNIVFQNISILGKKAASVSDLQLKSNAFVKNLKLIN